MKIFLSSRVFIVADYARFIGEILLGAVCGILLGSLIGWTIAKILVSL